MKESEASYSLMMDQTREREGGVGAICVHKNEMDAHK